VRVNVLEINDFYLLSRFKSTMFFHIFNTNQSTAQVEHIYYDTKNIHIKYIKYFNDTNLHREGDKPACIEYYPPELGGNIKLESYLINGNFHREGDKPAIIHYYENKNIKSEEYYINGNYYREGDDKPTIIYYYENGNIKSREYYYREGNTPHKIEHFENGKILTKMF